MLGVTLPPADSSAPPWRQEVGPTIWSAFPWESDYFGDPEHHWMVNFRVRDLDAMVARLRATGVIVETDPRSYPNGRFARLKDPEGNPVELWEPGGVARPP